MNLDPELCVDKELVAINAELNINPENLEAKEAKAILLNKKAKILANRGKFDDAIKALNHAIEANPHQAVFYINKASYLNKHEKYSEAIESAAKAMEIEPSNESVAELLSMILNNQYTEDIEKNNLNEALKKINKALELKPDNKTYLYNKAVVLYKLSHLSEAIDAVNRTLEMDSYFHNAKLLKSSILNSLSLELSDQNEDKEALVKVDEALRLKPNDLGFMINKGSFFIKLHMFDDCLKLVEQILKMDPTNKQAKKLRDITIRKMKK
jgi:tetratricopeptide (TPR) repeat protein